MKHKYLLGIYLCVIGLFLYLFYAMYTETKEKAIAELNLRQTIHAKQAKKGVEDFFNHVTAFLSNMSESNHIIKFDDQGRKEMNFALDIQAQPITAITRVDAFGKIVYSTPFSRDIVGRVISGQKHVQEIIKTHRPVVSDVFTAVQGYNAIALHVPIFNGNEFHGTLGVLIDFRPIAKRFLQEIRVGETGYAWVTSKEGIELYSPIPGHTGKSVFENYKDFPTILSLAKKMMKGGQGAATYLFNRVRDKQQETVKKHAVYMPIKIDNTFWTIVVESSEDEVLANLVGFKNKILEVVGLLLLTSLLFSYYGMKSWLIVREAAERKKAEEALRESEEKYRLLVENANDAIFIAQDEVIKFPNPKTTEIVGYSEDDLSKIPFTNLIHPEDREMVIERHFQRLKGEKPPSSYSFRIINKAGDELWVQLNAAMITWENRPATINLIRDITEQKQLENQLRQSHKMESIGTLAGGIAHEFNNILGIIIGNTELAIDDVPEWNPAKDCLEEIRTASLRAKDVVRQIMSFARKTPATRKPINISTIIKESLKLIRATIPTSIEIRQEIRFDSEMILANPTEINQILLNLCSNSAHAMEEETGILEVRLETAVIDDRITTQYEGLTAGEYVKLTVKDNGTGIDSKIKDRIFDPYFTTKDIDKGLGMGLAVVYGLVKKHDGVIKVMSKLGKGTTVEVLFPITEDEAKTEVEASDDLPTGKEQILFVDDEASLVKLVKQMLERQGYEVVGKTSSTEAFKLFQEKPDRFDLVITDMAMPDMPGDRFAKKIIKIRPNIPIIICTGHSDRIDEKRAKGLGIAAYTLKPLVKADLIKTVRKVLDDEAKS